MSSAIGRKLEYRCDSARLVGHYCTSGSPGARPGVVVVHDAFGVSEHIKHIAERVSGLGYAALAADLWGDGAQLRDESEIGPAIGRLAGDRKTWMGRLRAAREMLAAQDGVDASKVAFIGYCFGGASVLEYLRTVGGVRGVVSFHAGLDLVAPDWSNAPAGGMALVLTGAEDPLAPPAALQALQQGMTSADVNWEVHIHGHTRHGFTNPNADRANKPNVIAYNAQSDRRSWDAMSRFLHEAFAG